MAVFASSSSSSTASLTALPHSSTNSFNSPNLPIKITLNPLLLSSYTRPNPSSVHLHRINNKKPLQYPGNEDWRIRVSFFPSFFTRTKDSESLKEELLEAIAPLDRGAEASEDDKDRIDQVGLSSSSFSFRVFNWVMIFTLHFLINNSFRILCNSS